MQGGYRHPGCSQHPSSRSPLCSYMDEACGKASPAPQKWPDPSPWPHPMCPTVPTLLTKHLPISVPQSHVSDPRTPCPGNFPILRLVLLLLVLHVRLVVGRMHLASQGPRHWSRWGGHLWCRWTGGILFARDPPPGHGWLLRVVEGSWWALGIGDGRPFEGGL